MFEVSVSGWFAAAHQLRLATGRHEPLHGHNWKVTATFVGARLDGIGVLADFTQLQPRLRQVLDGLHDRNLNELAPFADCNPSAENVAVYIGAALADAGRPHARLACIEVEETPGCVARYRPD